MSKTETTSLKLLESLSHSLKSKLSIPISGLEDASSGIELDKEDYQDALSSLSELVTLSRILTCFNELADTTAETLPNCLSSKLEEKLKLLNPENQYELELLKEEKTLRVKLNSKLLGDERITGLLLAARLILSEEGWILDITEV